MAKQKKKKKSGFRLIHLALMVVIVYVTFTFNSQRIHMNNLETEKTEIEEEIAVMEEEIEALKEEIENSDSLEFVEKVARDELGMVKPREIIYIDVNKPKDTLLENLKGDK